MTEHTLIVFGLVAGLLVLGVVSIGVVALMLGRPLRAHGRARIGQASEFTVGIEVPGAAPRRRRALERAE